MRTSIAISSLWLLAACASSVGPVARRGDEVAEPDAQGGEPTATTETLDPEEAERRAEAERARRCEAVAADQAAFQARGGEGDLPHAVAWVPFELLDSLVAPQVAAIDPHPIRGLSAGSIGLDLSGLAARVRRVTFRPAPPGHIGLRIIVGIENRGRRLFDLVADATVEPELDREASRLVIAIDREDLAALEPRPGDRAAEQLGAELRRMLPPLIRGVIGASVLRSAARALLAELLAQGWPAVRSRLAGEVGSLPGLDIDLDGIPLESLSFRSEATAPGRLVVSAMTTLPVRGAAPAPATPVGETGRAAMVFVPGAAAAELGNWAMATGRAPSRFDSRGRPAEEGPFEIGLAWGEGARPLHAHLWSRDACAMALVSARPEARVDGTEVELRAAEVTVESFEGPLSLRLAALSSRLWGGALDLGSAVARQSSFTVGDRDMTASITSVEPVDGGFRAAIEISGSPTQ